MANHSSILAWRIPGTEEPGGLPQGHKESDVTEGQNTSTHAKRASQISGESLDYLINKGSGLGIYKVRNLSVRLKQINSGWVNYLNFKNKAARKLMG